jgi:cell division protein FtsQ
MPRALRRTGEPIARFLSRRRVRIVLVCALAGALVMGGGWWWFRKSEFVSVRTVRVIGAGGPQAHAIESALRSAAHGMSTLDLDTASLRAAVAQFPLVRGLHVSTHFPHTLVITLDESRAVAALAVGDARTAVAADGLVLGAAVVTAGLPTVNAQWQPQPGQSVHEAGVLSALAVLGAAPAALAARVASVYTGSHGLTVAMRNGLLVYFGDTDRAHAKWLALERVLLDEGSAGASYIDVRLPERAAAGGFPGGTPPPVSSPNDGEVATTDPATEASVAALAEGLRASSPDTGADSPAGANEPSGGGSTPSAGGTSAGAGTSEPEASAGHEEGSVPGSSGGASAAPGTEASTTPATTAEPSSAGGAVAAPGG